MLSPRRPISAIHIYDHIKSKRELVSHQYPRDQVLYCCEIYLAHIRLMFVVLAPAMVLFATPLASRICTSVLETKIVSSTSVTDIRFKPLSTDHAAGLALQRLVCYEIGWCRCRAIRSRSHVEVWTIGGGSRRGRLEPDSRKRRTIADGHRALLFTRTFCPAKCCALYMV